MAGKPGQRRDKLRTAVVEAAFEGALKKLKNSDDDLIVNVTSKRDSFSTLVIDVDNAEGGPRRFSLTLSERK